MGDKLRYDGKVAVITGAGGGLGRAYALALGERGAKVVVNDLGGDIRGGGKGSAMADQVVEEIKAKGGTAVANYDSVEDGDKIIQTALDNFGRIDILVNNAGILRDRSFARTSNEDWDIIHRVHLRGSFLTTRAAWEHMKKQNFGRIIMTTSAAGIYGNFGQANYSAAKLGLLGLSNTLSIEGAKYNINCNTIAPIAGSRLTLTVMPQEIVDQLKPEFVAPLVLWLVHENCDETGSVFETGAGWMGKLRWQRTQGVVCRKPGQSMTPESVRDNWEKICSFDDPTYPDSMRESSSIMYQTMGEFSNENNNSNIIPRNTSSIDPSQAIGHKLDETHFEYSERDSILYNLGVGVSTKHENYLKFLFEMSDEFCVLPTYAVIPALHSSSGMAGGSVPGLSIDPTQILHGEQYLEVYRPLPTTGKLTSKAHIADVLDKGKGALIIVNVETFDEGGQKIAFNQVATYIQRAGGFGGKRTSDKVYEPVNPPNRAPDASVSETVGIDQAALYRLSGDRNPLHIDPSFAAMGGFAQPILHGLCSFGYAARHILQHYAGGDVSKFKAIKVRFSRPVLPGQTIQTDMWKEGSRIHFQCKVVETGEVSLTGSYLDLTDGAIQANPTAGSTVASSALFDTMAEGVKANPAQAKQPNAIYLFNITKDGATNSWTAELKGDNPSVYAGTPKSGKADCEMTIADQDFVDMSTGKLDGQKAFFSGKLKIKGNIMLSQKLGTILKQNQSKL